MKHSAIIALRIYGAIIFFLLLSPCTTIVWCLQNNAASNLLSTDAVQNMVSFVEMYDAQTARLDDSLHALDQETRRQEDTINAIRKNLGDMNSSSATNEARSALMGYVKDP